MQQEKHTTARNPIFVVGYMHSGTTLLLNILANHPTIFSGLGETNFFARLPLIRQHSPDLDNDESLAAFINRTIKIIRHGYNRVERRDENSLAPTSPLDSDIEAIRRRCNDRRRHDLVFAEVFDYLTQQAAKTRWLEKTPTHIFHIDDISACVPNAQFVEIVRDPRDVLASKKTRRKTVWTSRYQPEQRLKKHFEKAYDVVWDSLLPAGAEAEEAFRKGL
jgi:hypothetical protein